MILFGCTWEVRGSAVGGENVATPFRVMSSRAGHRYDMALYGALNGRVDRIGMPASFPDDESTFLAALDGIDLFHMHWPELLLERTHASARAIDRALAETGVMRIVWTQHNLLPHTEKNDWPAIYQLWADAAMGIIHHSQWGLDLATGFRAIPAKCRASCDSAWSLGRDRINDQHLDRETLARPYKLIPRARIWGSLAHPGQPRTSVWLSRHSGHAIVTISIWRFFRWARTNPYRQASAHPRRPYKPDDAAKYLQPAARLYRCPGSPIRDRTVRC